MLSSGYVAEFRFQGGMDPICQACQSILAGQCRIVGFEKVKGQDGKVDTLIVQANIAEQQRI